jgi:hypothetical protein
MAAARLDLVWTGRYTCPIKSLYLIKHHAMKVYVEWMYSSTILDGGEWSASRLCHFTPSGKTDPYENLNWSIIFGGVGGKLSVVRFNENQPSGLQLVSCAQAGGLRELNRPSIELRTRLYLTRSIFGTHLLRDTSVLLTLQSYRSSSSSSPPPPTWSIEHPWNSSFHFSFIILDNR